MTLHKRRESGKSITSLIMIEADESAVWKCLTEPAALKAWWGSGVRIDPRKGGEFEEVWTDEEGEQHRTAGRVLALEPPSLLRLSWQEAEWDHETEVGFWVRPVGAQTEVQVSHGPWDEFPEEKREPLMTEFRQGWAELLQKLKQFAERF
jgi:uncharacterized protein YndB with AHSA1/START domain